MFTTIVTMIFAVLRKKCLLIKYELKKIGPQKMLYLNSVFIQLENVNQQGTHQELKKQSCKYLKVT